MKDRVRAVIEIVTACALALALRPVRLVLNFRKAQEQKHLLIVAPGAGSVGDQAMFEAFVHGVRGSVVVVARDRSVVLAVPDSTSNPISYLYLPNLLYGTLTGHLKDMSRLSMSAIGAATVSVIGADVMDGFYSERASVRRFRVSYCLTWLGLDARILGFSWNNSAPISAISAMKLASRRVALVARDPISYNRLRGDGARKVVLAADLAFLTQPAPHTNKMLDKVSDWIESQKQDERTVVIVNLNYALSSKLDQVKIFSELIDEKTSEHFSFVLLAHDSRGPESDEFLSAALLDAVRDKHSVYRVPGILPPRQVCRLAAMAAFVVTGRMHLAILSATAGTPSLSLSYQGKVEGLYQFFESPHWVDPVGLTANELNAAFNSIDVTLTDIRAALETKLSYLRSLAILNIPA